MKRLGICILLLCLLTASALGEIIPPQGMGQNGYDAVVISKNISVRPTQNANARAVTRLNYGTHLTVMSLGNGWCECYLTETEGVSGYVLEDYILIDPYYVTIEESTPVYAWQSTRAKRVGLISKGETYPIIMMDGSWLLISLRGAAGWIRTDGATAGGTTGGTTGGTSGGTAGNTSGSAARMKSANVLSAAQAYLVAEYPWITYDALKSYYVNLEYDAAAREWRVTFNDGNGNIYEVSVDDRTGVATEGEPVNG